MSSSRLALIFNPAIVKLLGRIENKCYFSLMLPDEDFSPEQIAALRNMTGEQRWRAARQLYWTIRRHKSAFLRSQHPEWTEQKIEAEVREIFLNART